MTTTRTGEIVSIDLPATPSTGYKWDLAEIPDGIELVGSTFTPPPADIVGGTGVQRFDVRALQPGAYILTFVLKRPWESESAEINNIELHVD
jgi:inhibitor of cysteine peptidase